jgi:hypothetical protein
MDAALGDCIRRLAGRKEPAPLVPKKIWDPELEATIERLLPDTEPLKSALHLWNDNLNRAHEIAQEIGTATGSYLHGLMHRREPDYGNSRYWFRRVGEHPHFPGVRLAALELLSGRFSELSDIRAAVENSPISSAPSSPANWDSSSTGAAGAPGDNPGAAGQDHQ